MNIRNKLIKIADIFDQAGESNLANAIDETLLNLEQEDKNDLMILEEKTMEDFSSSEKNIIRSFMTLFFHELEDELGKDLADKIENMIIEHIG